MKKIRVLISLIYIISFLIIGSLTIYFLAKTIKQGVEIYFQEKGNESPTSSFDTREIERIVELLKKFKFIE